MNASPEDARGAGRTPSGVSGDPDMNALQDHVLVALRKIIRATDLHSRKLERETGLTTPQLVIMTTIRQRGTALASEIAHSVSLSPATVTHILNRLEDHGLIYRERSNEDRRRINIGLTPKGKSLVKAAPEPLQQSFIQRFGALEGWEQHQLVASLERLASMMDAEHLDASPILTPDQEMQ